MEASLTCWRYCPAVSGVRLGPLGQGWVLNQSAVLVWYSAVVCLSRNMLGTLRFYGGTGMGWVVVGVVGATRDAEGVPKKSVLVRDGTGGARVVYS